MEYILLAFAVWFFVIFCQNVNKSAKTGSYKQANSTKQRRKMLSEKWAIEAKHPYGAKYDENSACYRELQAHKERWGEPGSKAHKEIQEKKAKWDAGQRW